MIGFVKNGSIKVPKLKDGTRVEIKVIRNTRTSQQRKAIEVYCKLIADNLNDAGLDMKKVIKADIPFTQETVKKELIHPVINKLFGYTSTTQLKKSGDIELMCDVLMRALSKWNVYVEFPSIDNQNLEDINF